MTIRLPNAPRTVFTASLAALCLAGGYGLGMHDASGGRFVAPPAPSQISVNDQRAFNVVWETLGTLERDYYRPERLDAQQMASAAAKAMVDAVGDPYTTLSDPQHPDAATAQLRGTFEGVGIELDRRDGQYTVVAPLVGSPAERAGVHASDAIVSVDGEAVSGLSLDELARRIRGPRGSQVLLGVSRDGQLLELALVRDTVTIESVRGRLLRADVPLAYVRITTFAEPTGQQLREQLGSLIAQDARGVVLDLRGNPGGYLTSAVDVTSAFLNDGVVLYQARDSSTSETRRVFRTTGTAQVPDLPLAVLVDHGSASAAEIVAAALRDHQRAVLIGQQTFGKGTVQELHTLSDASQLRLTVAQWLTPSGHAIQGEGLQPDVAVAAVEGQDAPLDAAVQLLRERVAGHG
jgi:carboxyl-terminal processing protease